MNLLSISQHQKSDAFTISHRSARAAFSQVPAAQMPGVGQMPGPLLSWKARGFRGTKARSAQRGAGDAKGHLGHWAADFFQVKWMVIRLSYTNPRPKSFKLAGLFTTDAWEIVAPWLVSSSCGSFIRKALAVILHPLMLSGLGITATPSRVKDVITNSAALQVIRARFIVCLDFNALITGLLVWHWNSSCKIPVGMDSTLSGRLGFNLASTCGTEWPACPMHVACCNSVGFVV